MAETNVIDKLAAWIKRKQEKLEDIEIAIASGNEPRLAKIKEDITAEIGKLKAELAKERLNTHLEEKSIQSS